MYIQKYQTFRKGDVIDYIEIPDGRYGGRGLPRMKKKKPTKEQIAEINQMEVWDDINRMRTLNTDQSRRRKQMHVCPLQLDIVERIINRYSNEGDLVYDPFGGLMTVPMMAVKMHRRGYGCELNPDYFRDGVGYLQEAENEIETPTLFDFMGEQE